VSQQLIKKIKTKHPFRPPLGSIAGVEERIYLTHTSVERPIVVPWALEKARAEASLNFEALGGKLEGAPYKHKSVIDRELLHLHKTAKKVDLYPPRINYYQLQILMLPTSVGYATQLPVTI
jgi:hypothetical protein